MTITDLCAELRNWFDVKQHIGTFEIKNGTLDLNDVSEGQHFRIINSKFNDGVHVYADCELQDETFDGAVWIMNVPPAFLQLLNDINTYEETYSKEINSPYTSENLIGVYSYTKDSNVSWQEKFAKRLNIWRKL